MSKPPYHPLNLKHDEAVSLKYALKYFKYTTKEADFDDGYLAWIDKPDIENILLKLRNVLK